MAKAKKTCYAVLKGRQPGLYRSWDECKKQVDRYPGAVFLGFFSHEAALEWIRKKAEEPVPDYTTKPAAIAPAQVSASTSPVAGLLLDRSTQGRTSINGLSSIPTSSLSSVLSSRSSSSSGPSAFYAVARGRQPGIYHTWEECEAQVDRFSGARYKKFKILEEATEFCAVYGGGGHFSQFTSEAFEPEDTASFGDEWARLSQSQGWTRGTRHYNEQRACALRNELQTHFFASSSRALPAIKSEESEEESSDAAALAEIPTEEEHQRHEEAVKLHGFQSMCEAVGKHPGDTIEECERTLNQTLVNIVDLIDAYRTGRGIPVKIWTDFEAFRSYTLNSAGGDKTIPAKVAAKDPLLKCFLQNFRRYRPSAMGCGSAMIKKRARSEEANDFEDCGHQNKRTMCC